MLFLAVESNFNNKSFLEKDVFVLIFNIQNTEVSFPFYMWLMNNYYCIYLVVQCLAILDVSHHPKQKKKKVPRSPQVEGFNAQG